ncbi:hypothetical protein HF521_006572 [Silurus meridionalis]|uniref:Alpha-2-macroglobulin-like protein 1 n=1 Tax=Silurus meridionalis TaxID=175797 RepID=A0A8T0ASW8_SILME|nr:hypothetical protein HF521_006572 [Silurus meridionalis]
MGPSKEAFALLLLLSSVVVQTTSTDTNPPDSGKNKNKNPTDSGKDNSKHPPDSGNNKDKTPPDSGKDKAKNIPASGKDKAKNIPDSGKEKDKNPPDSGKDKDKHPPKSGKDKDKNPTDSGKDKDKHPPESGKDKDKHPPGSGKDKEEHPSDSGKDKDKNSPGSGKDKDKHPPDSGKDKDKHPPDSSKDKDKNPPGSGKDKDKHPPDSGKDKDKHPHDSGKNKDKHPPDSGKDKDKHPPDSGKDKDKHPPDSGKDKDKHPPTTGKDKDKHPPDSDKDKNKNSPGSGKDKVRHPSDSGKDKDKHPPDSGKDKDKHSPGSGKDKEEHPSDSVKDKDKNHSDSGKDKDKHPPDSGKDKDKHPPDSGKDKDKHPPGSGKDKDKHPPGSGKDKDKHPPDSGKDKDKHPSDSGKDKDKDPPGSGKDKDKHPPGSGKDKDKHPPGSGKDKDKHPSDSGKDKDKNPPGSGKDKDKHPPDSGKDKDKHPPDSGKDKDKNPPGSGKDKDKHPLTLVKTRTSIPMTLVKQGQASPDSGKDKDKHPPDSDKNKNSPGSGKDKVRHPSDSGKDKDKHPLTLVKTRTSIPWIRQGQASPGSGKDKDKHPHDSGKDKDKHPLTLVKTRTSIPLTLVKTRQGSPGSGKDKDKHPPGSGKDKDKHPPGSGKDKDKHPSDSGKDKDKNPPGSGKDKDKHPPDSGKDKDKHPPDSGKDKDKNPPGSGKDKDKHPPDSGKDKDKHPPDSGKDKDKNPPGSGKDKDKHPPDSGTDKDKNPPGSGKDKDKHPPNSGKDKDKNPPGSGKDKDKHPPNSGKDKDKNPPGSSKDKDSVYLLAVTSQAVGGTTEMLCVTVNPSETVSITITLEYNQNNVTILTEMSITQQYYNCIPFQVPVVTVDTVASIKIQIKGSKTTLNNKKNILITPSSHLIIIQTDKPIYKPGQTVNFRIASLDTNFLTYDQKFPTIEVQDPNSNRIGQWLQVTTLNGLVDLSYPINSEATKGFYIITIWDEKNQQITQTFEVKDYVLPTFEVTVQLPPVITILDTTATLKVCAKYTYGKPVSRTVKATVCHKSYKYGMFTSRATTPPDICKTYTIKSDKSGCGLKTLNLEEFALIDSRYEASIVVQCEVEEDGTGVILTASGSSYITSNIVTLSFEDSPAVFKQGIAYDGKIKVLGPDANPVKRKVVHLTATYGNNKKSVRKLITSSKGIAKFSFNTEPWGSEQVTLEAQYATPNNTVVYRENQLTPNYPTAYLWLQPFYSKSRSFIKFKSCPKTNSCNKKAVIEAQYMIQHSALKKGQKTITFFYMVMNKGHLIQQGKIKEEVKAGTEHRGTLVITLQNMLKMTPVAQVVLYTILLSGEAVADSMNVPIQLCLANKVSLTFSPSTALPGGQTSLLLSAAPGSLCSVKAIDQSLLLLQPEKELSIESVFNMLPVQTLSGYPYNVYEDDSNPCLGSPFIKQPLFAPQGSKRIGYFPHSGTVDVYSTFKDIGVKILTNADIMKPSVCDLFPVPGIAFSEGAVFLAKEASTASADTTSSQPAVTIRIYFPETWIWDLISVSHSGSVSVSKTVPDSITTWQAGAFCTSPIGFGVAPGTELTAFQPFFVSLTMPSSVIRGEEFTLKATVFNYLQSCMMVKVTLADSQQFSVHPCTNCVYTHCLCADESWTFSWTISPLVLGEVSIKVTAEALDSSVQCGGNEVTVPQQGRIDTIIKTLLVLAEGIKQSRSYNELLCPSGVLEETVSLSLPSVFVEGSATASVSILGDLMGRALQNLDSLLAMPYGCGEQNMLRFAPNIFILKYLDSTNQLTPAIRSTAETYLVSGYQRELTYKHNDGSYSAFGMSDASGNTWLTAFVMKSFGFAKNYIFVDQVFVDQAKIWLGQQQKANGCFASVGQLFHSDLKGGVNDEVTLTAYITAAMLELNYPVSDPVVAHSLTCLTNAYTQVNSNYAKALLFYTFTLAGNQAMRNTLILNLDAQAITSGGGRHWSREDDMLVTDSLEVEMTSYVLLALMSGPQMSGFGLGYSSSIVRWISLQQNAFGGFASTQDTVVALQALAKYSLATFSPAGTVTVTVTSPSGQITTFIINQSNRLLYQESQLQEVNGDYRIRAEGEGCVYVQFTLHYNIPPPPDSSSFTISASTSGDCKVQNPSFKLTITVMYKGQRVETNMVVIDVKPLSGFRVDETSVQLVNSRSNEKKGAVKRVDQINGNAVIYLNGLTNGEVKVYTMTIIQDIPVQNMKPAVVKVYDYYEIGETASTSYTSPCIV